LDSDVSSPNGTPSFISAEDRHVRKLKSPNYVHLHIGRDGGGTYSGHASVAGSDEELSSDEDHRHHHHSHHHSHLHPPSELLASGNEHLKSNGSSLAKSQGMSSAVDEVEAHAYVDTSGMGRGAKAHRLGDHSQNNSDLGSDRSLSPEGDVADMTSEEIDKAEEQDRSIMGSVY
jgi:hypothetical protein